MKLEELLDAVPINSVEGDTSVEISSITFDSRKVVPGSLFCTWKGDVRDGHDFVADALERGAAAVVLERNGVDMQVPKILVESGRSALSLMAANFYERPAERLSVVGITGTNGKTSTANLVQYLMNRWGEKCGLIGTIGYDLGGRRIEATRTTPEGGDLQAYLGEMVRADCSAAVMEVSSHSLDQGRVKGIPFEVAVFTNLSQDHLDYHEDMDAYFAAKRKLFDGLEPGSRAVVNMDDLYGRNLAEELGSDIIVMTYGIEEGAFRAVDVELSAEGTRFVWKTPTGCINVRTPWLGRFSVHNVLAAATTLCAMGASYVDVAEWLSDIPPVPGRMEPVPIAGNFQVLIDYAHSPDAIHKVLDTLKPLAQGKLTVVIGCGGDRDQAKRPLMAEEACMGATQAIFTSDNPRSEDPQAILDDMIEGVRNRGNFEVIVDREAAILTALKNAEEGDIVLIAGKGHEDYQEINGKKLPFSDRSVVESFKEGQA